MLIYSATASFGTMQCMQTFHYLHVFCIFILFNLCIPGDLTLQFKLIEHN